MINIEPKVIFKVDQLWRWLSPLTTAAAKGGKSDEAPSGAKIRPNGKETKQFGAKKQPNWSTPSDQAILISLACLGQSVSWNHKIGVLLVKPKVTVKHQVGKTLFENIEYQTAITFCITPSLDWNSNIWRKILPNLATHAAKYSFIQNWSLYLFCKWKFMLTWEIIDHSNKGREHSILYYFAIEVLNFSGKTPNSFGDCLWRHVEDWAPGGEVFFWLENFIRGSTPVSGALSTIIALHFTNT